MPSTETGGHIDTDVHRFDSRTQIDISAKGGER